MSDKITLAIRPSLAFPKRWSIDFWHNSRVEATYQAALFTYDSPDEAASEAANIQLGLEARGVEITRVKCDSNASRTIELPRENEEAIAKHLEAHVKSSFSFLKKFSLATLFDITSWAKGLKAVASRSPHVLSLIVLGTLFFRGPFERLLRSIVPKELELSPDVLLASAPLLLFVVTYFTYLKRVQMSNQLDRVRQWILQLVVLYGWDHVQVRTLVSKELAELEYASVMNIIDPASRQSPSSFSNLVQALGGKLDRKSGEGARDLVDVLLRDDFARKIQALAGMAAEPDYRPKQLGIIPLYFLLSISSVKSTVQGLLLGRGASSIESVKVYHDGMILIGMMLGMLLSLLVICPTLIWTTILAWQVSPLLFTFDVIASVLTVLLLTWRPVAAAIRRRFVPSGLYLHECAGAFHFV